MTGAAVVRAAVAVWDVFLLRDRERVAASCAATTRDEVRALALAGRSRAQIAERLLEGHFTSALTMYRESAIFYLAAVVAARTGDAPPDPLRGDHVLARFEELDVPLDGTPARAAFLDHVREPDLRALERLEPDQAGKIARASRLVVRDAAALVEPRGPGEIRFVRRARIAAIALVGLVGLALVVWSVASKRGSSPNIALYKPVAISGAQPGGPPPGGLTDGVITGSYGVHTKVGDIPWVSVDLQGLYFINTVKVYNRGDGWFEDGLPMTVQLSENGKVFFDVGMTNTTFGQWVPWTIKVGHRRARWVRVRGGDGRYLALSELEVFGDRQ
jgi:hypothetical protein